MPPEMITAHVNGTGFAYDADLGWYWGMLPSKDAGIDEHGFREHNTPVSVAKPPGITGVITFGDSQTYGAGVRPDETWSAQAEAALGPGYEVLNAGLSGYRSLNVLRLIKLRAAAYSPDAVVIDCMPYDSPRDDGLTLGAPVGWQDPVRRLLWSSRIQSESSPLARPLGLTGGPAKPWQPRSDRGLGERGAACGSSSCNTPHMDNRSGRIRCQTGQGELPEGYPVGSLRARRSRPMGARRKRCSSTTITSRWKGTESSG